MTDAQIAQLRKRLLGRGLALVPVGALGRDLQMAADGTDLAMVQGVDNLAQALTVAVLTPLGGDPFNTEFGFDGLNALAEEATPMLQRERVRVSIVQLLQKMRGWPASSTCAWSMAGSTRRRPARPASSTSRWCSRPPAADRFTLSAGNAGTRLTNG